MSIKFRQSIRRSMYMLCLAVLILAVAQVAQAADGTLPVQTTIQGNYCVAHGGIGLLDGNANSFTVDVEGTPVQAYLYWSARYPGAGNGDNEISIDINGGGYTSVTADAAEEAYAGFRRGGNDIYYYTYRSGNVVGLLPGGGTLNFTAQNLSTPEAHGAGIVVISEGPDCAYSQVQLNFGLDGFYWGFDPDAGPDTQVTCVDVPASDADQTMNMQMFVGGVEHDEMRGDRIWFATGTGTPPTDIIGTGTAANVLDGPVPPSDDPPPTYPLTGGIGDWDDYANSIIVPAGDTYACFQIESIDGQDPKGTSGVWLELLTQFYFNPGIDVVKLTNGSDAKNADDADVPVIEPGAQVVWTYLVTNTGEVAFAAADVSVVDSVEGPVTNRIADTTGNNDDTFEPGEVWTYQLTGTALTLSDSTETYIVDGCGNAATGGVTRSTYANGVTAQAGELTATDTSHYCNPLATAAVGNRVWGDIDPDGSTPGEIAGGDGIQDDDAREQGIAGIIVELYSADGQLIDTKTTDDNGEYLFTEVEPGDYYLLFINPLTEGIWTLSNQGDDDEVDSDVEEEITDDRGDAERTPIFTLEPGETDLSWDAGLIGLSGAGSAAVGNFVWNDLDKDGLQDTGEAGVPGITVRLYQVGNATPIAETTTDDQGIYNFPSIDPGDYYVEFDLPDTVAISTQNVGDDDEIDSDVDPTTKRTENFNVPVFTTDLRWDAGLQIPTNLGETDEPVLRNRIFLPLVTK